jgi:tripartite-type tricarboxylate transporter receptor subunit TctC
VSAQGFPKKPLQIVVPWAAGGQTDMITRLAAHQLTKFLGQPVVVLNKPGGAIAVGTDFVMKEPADGYTLVSAGATLFIAPKIQKMPYTVPDLIGLGELSESKCAILVRKDAPWSNLKEFVEDAKKRPGDIYYGIPGTGNVQTVWWESLKEQAGINIVSVPYSGDAPIIAALLGGDVKAGFIDMPLVLPHVKAGTLKALAISDRDEDSPGVMTFKDQGFEGKFVMWRALSVRTGTPKKVYAVLEDAFKKMLIEKSYADALRKMGSIPGTMTGEKFVNFVKNEDKLYAEMLQKIPKK